MKTPDPEHSERIVVRCVNWLGDAVMTTPALLRLRQAKPQAHITLLSHEKLAELWQGQPYLNEVLTFGGNDTVWQTGRRLKEKQFDLGFAFPNSIRSALELWLARIPCRIGYSRLGRSWLLSRPVAPRAEARRMRKPSDAEVQRLISKAPPAQLAIPRAAHHIFDYLGLVAAAGASSEPCAPILALSDDEVDNICRHLGMAPGAEPWFGLNPGAEYGPAKRWPAERFAAAAVEIANRVKCRWVIFGGAGDAGLADGIAARIEQSRPGAKVLNLAGRTSLRQLLALLKNCRLLLTNDTGPMHLAAALGTPLVALFGSTSPELTGPVFSCNTRVLKAAAPCAPCFRKKCPIDFRCMNQLEPKTVAEAALQLLYSFK